MTHGWGIGRFQQSQWKSCACILDARRMMVGHITKYAGDMGRARFSRSICAVEAVMQVATPIKSNDMREWQRKSKLDASDVSIDPLLYSSQIQCVGFDYH